MAECGQGEQLGLDPVDASLQGSIKTDLEEAADELDSQCLLPEVLISWGQPLGGGNGISQLGVSSARPPGVPSSMDLQSREEDLDAALSLMKLACSRLDVHSAADSVDCSGADDWAQHIHSIVLQPEAFKAGFISSRLPVWEFYFDKFGWSSKTKEVFTWLKEGLQCQWVPVDHPAQLKHPRYHKRLSLVHDLLVQTLGPDQARLALKSASHRQ